MKQSVYIIAEAGVNHNGSLELAKRLIFEAKSAGVDAVKFQTFKAEKLVSLKAPKADYQKKNADSSDSQYEMIKNLELTESQHYELKSYCEELGIVFLSSAFDLYSIDFLKKIGLKLFKIPSGEITNYPYLKKISNIAEEIIISTGMSNYEDIDKALTLFKENGFDKDKITVLHCNTEYPTPFKDVNLKAMLSIRDKFGVAIGYSDHTKGIEVSIAAVAMGATVIEKHFTLDNNMIGPDHKASLNPIEFKYLVKCIRNIELALGDGYKVVSESEKKNINIARKSIHSKQKLAKGHIISENDIEMKRPGDGISPMLMNDIIGKKLLVDVDFEHKFKWEDFE
ncbi:MAG: N-acetylneuraminate synthase [Bacteroidetes bacterium GWE2_29_8]|nr:MAG: N-acetylneuraminate synthase [Bacteroidetes bacterium GWE2_29_8]OFY20040.1 MAG: N-acetylneuraminate synthase [Bacteroidetes bacterium GWF2_29_10]